MSGIKGGNLGSPRVLRVPVVTRLNQSFIKKADSNLKNELQFDCGDWRPFGRTVPLARVGC